MNLEDMLRDERSRVTVNPLDTSVDQIVAKVRRRRRVRAAAGGGAAVAVVTGALVLAAQLPTPRTTVLPAGTEPTSSTAPPPDVVSDGSWDARTPFVAVDAVPYAGTTPWSDDARIGSFTVVSSGVVYLDATTAQVVVQDWARRTTVIGAAPWHAGGDTSQGGVRDHQWGQYRDMVGSASGDQVAWVERNGDQRGDLVVVDAGTGAVLARTPVPGPPELPVIIAGVDDDTVHFGVGSTTGPFAARDVWVWRWHEGRPPERPDHLEDSALIMDVSGDTWAVDAGATLQFRDAAGAVLAEVHASYEDRTFFGGGLSPDGRLWYGPAHFEVVDTATGERVHTPGGTFARYGWTGPTELTFIERGLKVCDGTTGTCTEPIPIPSAGPCTVGDPYCGYNLPAY